MMRKSILCLLLSVTAATYIRAEEIPPGFPEFIVPGHEAQMHTLRQLFYTHEKNAQPLIPLWDEWMTTSTCWTNPKPWDDVFSNHRPLDEDGYLSSFQHDGTAHARGWPFPLWHQGAGMGWHFAPQGIPGYEAPQTRDVSQWKLTGCKSLGFDAKGWRIELTDARAIIETPAFAVTPFNAPFTRLNWYSPGLNAKCAMQWATKEIPEFSDDRTIEFAPAGDSLARTMMKMYVDPKWNGTITRMRIVIDRSSGAVATPPVVTIKSFHTAYDSRQNINNSNFVTACCNYIKWTGDVGFLKRNISNMRRAMDFMEREFHTREKKCVFTDWVGHDSLSGVVWKDSQKKIRVGHGIGSDYWDILPFGREDVIATIYYYHALNELADVEEAIAKHPEWQIEARDANDLRQLAQAIKASAGQRFWSSQTGRFTSGIDAEGNQHDYGFTFVNLEAINYDFATQEQAKSIMQWITGERKVDGDTSQGDDIYHWRFGPRATTKRNIGWYFWGWSAPESLAFGDQVQDGGAVLGFTYFDHMSRIKTLGPDSALQRIDEMTRWFDDVQKEGGYQQYYSKPGRGTLQGGNVAGGLGVVKEFFESALCTQSMLYGFVGMTPTMDGCEIKPALPSSWPELTITDVHLHGVVMDVKVTRDSIVLTGKSGSGKMMVNHQFVDIEPGKKIVQKL